MALGRPPDPSTTLDREDHEGYREGIRRRWSAVSYLLGVRYNIEDLDNPAVQDVLDRILDHIERVRGAVVNRANLEALLQQTYTAEQQVAQNAVPPNTIASAAEQQGLANASGLLEVMNRHFGREEIRGLMNEIPSAIRPLTADGRWEVAAVNLGSPPISYAIRIMITDPAWRSGDEATIRQKLVGHLPSEVGIDTPYANVLSAEDVTNILGSTCNIISQRVPLWDLELPDVPIAGQRTLVDMAGMLRENPYVATENAGTLQTEFAPGGTYRGLFNRHVRRFNAAGTLVAVTVPVQINTIVDQLFTRLNRTGKELAQDTSTLSAAINRRASVDRLVSSDAKNRELLLALATVRRDPSVIDAITSGDVEEQRIRGELDRANRLFSTANAVKVLSGAQLPEFNDNRIAAGRVAMSVVSSFASAASGTMSVPGTPVAVPLDTGLTGPQGDELDDAGIPRTAQRENYAAVVVGGIVTVPARDNWGRFEKIIERTQEMNKKYNEAQRLLDEVCRTLDSMISALNERHITPALLPAANYGAIHRYLINIAGTAFAPRRDVIDRSMNVIELNRQFKQALLQVPPNAADRIALEDASIYEKRVQDLSTKHAEALAKGTGKLDGNKTCWDVIRRGLENQRHPPLSQEEIEATLKALRAQTQFSPEIRRDLELFQERDVPEGDGHMGRRLWNRRPWEAADREHFWQVWRPGQQQWIDDHAAEDWNKERVFRRLSRLGVSKTNPLEEYSRNLFQPGRIGLGLNDDPRQRRFRLPTLIDAYRRTKYLLEKASDPYRLPNSERYQRFVRRLHGAILERAFLSFEHASDMDPADMATLKSAGITDKMTADERLQAVRSFLVDGDTEKKYYESQKSIIEAMTKTAYRPIQRRIDAHNKWKARWGKVGKGVGSGAASLVGVGPWNKWYNPLAWPSGVVKGAAYGMGSVVDAGPWNSAKNPLTWPAKVTKATVQEAWKEKVALAAGAGAAVVLTGGFALIPMAVGGGVAVLAKKFLGGKQ